MHVAPSRRVPIESLQPGDVVLSLAVPGLDVDVPFRAQYDWQSTEGLVDARIRQAEVSQVTLGEHDGFFVINGRIKVTFEHPFLVRRGDQWGFCSADLLRIGDTLVTPDLIEEPINTIERISGRVRTVSITIPGTNTYLADGAWVHNDLAKAAGPSGSGAGLMGATGSGSLSSGSASSSGSGSGSDSGKSSGSSFSSSSGSSSSGGSSSGGSSSASSAGDSGQSQLTSAQTFSDSNTA